MTARPVDPATMDPELKRIMAKGALHLVKRQQPTPYERKALNHPDVVRATMLAEQATEMARIAAKLAKDLRMAARVAYSKELRRRATAEEIAAQEPELVEALKKSTERNDSNDTKET